MKKWGRRFTAMFALPALLLLGAEGLLRLTGYRPIANALPPPSPMFESLTEEGVVFWRPQKSFLIYPDNRLQALKNPKTFRIYCSGGSTVFGEPFSEAGWPAQLYVLLTKAYPEWTFEVINGGQPGASSTFELARLQEILPFELDLVIIQSGNNEFFARIPVKPLVARSPKLLWLTAQARKSMLYLWMRDRLGKISAHLQSKTISDVVQEEQEGVYLEGFEAVTQRYLDNLSTMFRLSKGVGSQVILSTTPANWRDWGPLLPDPMYTRNMAPPNPTLDAYFIGRKLLDERRPKEALKEFEKGGTDYSLFFSARAWEMLGDFNLALTLYKSMGEGGGLRAPPSHGGRIRRLCQERHIPLMDAEALFEKHSPHRLVGMDLILDYCHPSLEGYYLLATAYADFIGEKGWLPKRKNSLIPLEQVLAELHITCWNIQAGYNAMGRRALETQKFRYAAELHERGLSRCAGQDFPEGHMTAGLNWLLAREGGRAGAHLQKTWEQVKAGKISREDLWQHIDSEIFQSTFERIYGAELKKNLCRWKKEPYGKLLEFLP